MPAHQDLELRKAFFLESEEILARMATDLERLEKAPQDKECLNAVFRGIHTIKGNSSFLDLEAITKLSHVAETLLDRARNSQLAVDADVLFISRLVLEELTVMIGEQEVDRDVSALSTAMQKFLAGHRSPLAAFRKGAAHATAASGTGPAAPKVDTGNFVRVEEGKLGKIVSLANELELMRYSLERFPEKMDLLGPAVADLRFELDLQVSKLARLTRSLGSLIFGVRLVPVNQVFQRFPRVVTELARKLGKEIRLQVVNGEAELDKAIVEAIADPMIHLIRNAADHGVESAAERIAAGKPAFGTVRLNSFARGNFVYIEISDDGRGIDAEKVLRKAVEKGIVPADKAHTFSEAQKLALIFAPGFSTAETVTDISGRGVGMDVVKSNINRLKGTVIIESELGRGTVIQLRFPMSMMVMFSLIVDVKGICCTIAMDQVQESMDYPLGDLLPAVPAGANPDDYRALYPIQELLWRQPLTERPKAFHTLEFKDDEGRACAFIVDEFLSIEEAIVQSLDSYIAAMPGLQGATVRKDGSVALVLSTHNLIERARRATPIGYVRKRSQIQPDDANLADYLGIERSAG